MDAWDVHKASLKQVGCNVCLEGVLGPQDAITSNFSITCAVDPSLTTSSSEYRIFVTQAGVSNRVNFRLIMIIV